MAQDNGKPAIAAAFTQRRLQTLAGELIPCDHMIPLLAAPIVLIGYVLPLPALMLCFGQAIIRNPVSVVNFYRRAQGMDWRTNLVGAMLALFAIGLSLWLFREGWPQLQMVWRSWREWRRERKTGECGYGLLLTQRYFALRCFEPSYDKEPLILSRDEIAAFHLGWERSQTGKQRIYYNLVQVVRSDGTEENIRLPATAIDCTAQKLHAKFLTWLQR
jgi:hypothetical protein